MTDSTNKLQHIAIIMDGNGRWAKKRGLPRSVGHKKGAEVVKEITRAAGELGVKYLTLYAFSTENWQRDPEEVATLMGLLRDYLKSDLKEIQENGVRIIFIGERQMLDADIVEQMAKIEAETAHNDNDPVYCNQLRRPTGNCQCCPEDCRFGPQGGYFARRC